MIVFWVAYTVLQADNTPIAPPLGFNTASSPADGIPPSKCEKLHVAKNQKP